MKKNAILGLYKLHFNCGRMGSLTGLFTETDERIRKLVESEEEVVWGEVLGKHSDIRGRLEDCDFTLVTQEKKILELVEEFDLTTISSPVDTYIEYCEDQELKHIFQSDV